MRPDRILIAAALGEELDVALSLCRDITRLRVPGIRAWSARRVNRTVLLLRTGMGPARSENSLNLLLADAKPAKILVIGYGGALDPDLRLGDLVVGDCAFMVAEDRSERTDPEKVRLAGTWPLQESQELWERGNAEGLALRRGVILTSPHIIGAPEQKLFLYRKFQASIIDMETAALARASVRASVPLACVRAVSDTVQDEFLAPFSYDPQVTPATRALKLLAAGKWLRRYSQWRENAASARRNLQRFVTWYLDSFS